MNKLVERENKKFDLENEMAYRHSEHYKPVNNYKTERTLRKLKTRLSPAFNLKEELKKIEPRPGKKDRRKYGV